MQEKAVKMNVNPFKPQVAPAHTFAQDTPSLLGDWKAYAMQSVGGVTGAASASHHQDQEAGGMLKNAFSTVTNRVANLPGTGQSSSTSSLPSQNQLLYFAIMLGVGCFFIFISVVMFLPLIVIMPGKFASCFSVGSCLVVGSFFALKGPKAQFYHMISKERLPFTIAFVGSMVGAIYASTIMHSYLFCLLFSGIEVLALLYYVLSYFPGGTAGLKFVLSMIRSSVVNCFRR